MATVSPISFRPPLVGLWLAFGFAKGQRRNAMPPNNALNPTVLRVTALANDRKHRAAWPAG
jgi:hypothetical protein